METILEAWNNNQTIECKRKNSKTWVKLLTKEECPKIIWNAEKYDYRIANYQKILKIKAEKLSSQLFSLSIIFIKFFKFL